MRHTICCVDGFGYGCKGWTCADTDEATTPSRQRRPAAQTREQLSQSLSVRASQDNLLRPNPSHELSTGAAMRTAALD
jgi:hypothetical protein